MGEYHKLGGTIVYVLTHADGYRTKVCGEHGTEVDINQPFPCTGHIVPKRIKQLRFKADVVSAADRLRSRITMHTGTNLARDIELVTRTILTETVDETTEQATKDSGEEDLSETS